jgi:hypothetical protein
MHAGRITARTEPDLTSTWTYDNLHQRHSASLCSAASNDGYSRTLHLRRFQPPARHDRHHRRVPLTPNSVTYDGNGRVAARRAIPGAVNGQRSPTRAWAICRRSPTPPPAPSIGTQTTRGCRETSSRLRSYGNGVSHQQWPIDPKTGPLAHQSRPAAATPMVGPHLHLRLPGQCQDAPGRQPESHREFPSSTTTSIEFKTSSVNSTGAGIGHP